MRILGKADNDGRRPVDDTIPGDKQYGTLREVIFRDSNKTLDVARAEAKAIIKEYGKPEEVIQIDVPDLPFMRKGDKIEVEAGNLIGDDAWVLWCIKTIMTQRWAHLGYSNNAGIEAIEAFRQPDRKAQESAFTRTITEALLADPMGRTRQVRNFQYDWHADSLNITCEIFGAAGNSAVINARLHV